MCCQCRVNVRLSEVDVGSMWGRCGVDVWSMRSAYSFSRNQADEAFISSNESVGTHASHDDDDEDTEDKSSSETSFDKENDAWTTLINKAVSMMWDQYKEILQALLMDGHDESKAKEEDLAQILPAFRKKLEDVHMDLTWMTVMWKFSKASLKPL